MLLKMVQSAEARQPKVELLAVEQVSDPEELERPEPRSEVK